MNGIGGLAFEIALVFEGATAEIDAGIQLQPRSG